jgi:hypothetical protein
VTAMVGETWTRLMREAMYDITRIPYSPPSHFLDGICCRQMANLRLR